MKLRMPPGAIAPALSLLTALAAVTLCRPSAARASNPPYAYYHLEQFENAVDYERPTGWVPVWTPDKSYYIDEVPNGFGGVSAGPHGGDHFASVYGLNEWHPTDPALPTYGAFSYQVDLYADPDSANFMWAYDLTLQDSAAGEQMGYLATLFLGMIRTETDPSTGLSQRGYQLWDYYGQYESPILPLGHWYSVEWGYDLSDNIDPETGRPFVEQFIHVYDQAAFTADGRRQGDLVWAYRADYYSFDSSTRPDRRAVAGDAMSLLFVDLRGGELTPQPLYADNFGIGPLIVPEPVSGALLLAFAPVLATGRRRRPALRAH